MYICADADAYEAEAFHKGSCTYYVITFGGPERPLPPLCNIVIIWAYPPLCNTVIIWTDHPLSVIT